jgi:hypothetical protein
LPPPTSAEGEDLSSNMTGIRRFLLTSEKSEASQPRQVFGRFSALFKDDMRADIRCSTSTTLRDSLFFPLVERVESGFNFVLMIEKDMP